MITFRQNRRNRNGKSRSSERGVALIVALMALVLVAAITAGMMILSTTETSISANFRDEQTAFFASKAGIEEARDRLRIGATNTLRVGGAPAVTAFAGSPGGVVYIVNPNVANGETAASILTTYPDDEICKETQTVPVPCTVNSMGQNVATPGNWETTTAASATYAAAPVFPWKWLRINLKQNNENNTAAPSYNVNGNNTAQMVCWNGTNEYADPNAPNPALTDLGCTSPNLPVYVLTALSVTPSGSRRVVQAEVAEDKYPFTTPSTLTMDGTLTAFGGGSSNQWGVNGNDSPGCGVATVGPPVHAIGALNAAGVATIDAGISRPNNITGSGATTPDVANVSATMPANLQSVSSLQTLVSTMKANVTQPVINGPAGSLPNYGTAGNPQIIYVNGDLTLSGNAQGYGILVVTGTLTIKGTVGWNGIILVIGKGVFNTDGTDQYNGAVVVANTVDAFGNPLPVQGTSQVNVNGGGHGGFQYSSGCIAQATTLSTFHVAAFRELMR
jgi:hypothetical protein